MLASYLLNPSRQGHGLDALAQEHLNHRMISYSDVTGSGKDQKNFAEVEIGDRFALCLQKMPMPPGCCAGNLSRCWQREATGQTVSYRRDAAGADSGRDGESWRPSGLRASERPLCRLLRSNGQHSKNRFFLWPVNASISTLPNSWARFSLTVWGLKSGKKNKGKTGWSTDNEVLTSLAEEHEIARLILDYRTVAKLKSTYTDALPRLVSPRTGRVHTSYNQTVTNTGRLSSSDPNLQNIPIRSEEGRRIRHAFIAPPGHVILSADYSQIELRVLAHLSGDTVFCHAFANDEDIHTRTAAEVFGLFPEMVTPEMRRQAKTINFGIIYGQGSFSLAKQLGIARKTAEDFITTYKERHHGAIAFLDSCIREAEENGSVRTILGRRLPIPDIQSSNGNVLAFARRNAINYPIQGSAADIIKCAMIRVDSRIRQEQLQSRLIMQVHDELVLEVPEHETVKMEQLVEEEMGHAVETKVPLKVDISYGANWSEAH